VPIHQEKVITTQHNQILGDQTTAKINLNKRLEEIGWGLFLLLGGGILLAPPELLPQGTWLIGAGIILLGLNGARYFYDVKASGLTVILGSFAVAAGMGSVLGVKLPLFAVFLIIIGGSIILKSLFAAKS
jgi:hypothetical protein